MASKPYYISYGYQFDDKGNAILSGKRIYINKQNTQKNLIVDEYPSTSHFIQLELDLFPK